MRVLVLIALVLVAVPDREDPNKKDVKPVQEQLLGEWKCVKAVHDGRDEFDKKNVVVIFDKDVIRVREDGKIQQRDEAGYRIDSTKKPITIDLTPRNDPDLKIQGILKVEGDELVICFGDGPNAARPAEFVSAPNSRAALLYLKRVKK
jgi:uncharacterized protein (TIGR03067 family)